MAGKGFESIPGIDPGAITSADQVPRTALLIKSRIAPGLGAGVVEVNKSRSGIRARDVYVGKRLEVELGNYMYTDVVCEPANYSARDIEPCSRPGVTWAGFEFENALEVPLSGGGRLLVDRRTIDGNGRIVLGRSIEGRRGDADIHRIVRNTKEAELAVLGIGAYMGLSEADARSLAKFALDFSRRAK